jgi:angiopoietin 2
MISKLVIDTSQKCLVIFLSIVLLSLQSKQNVVAAFTAESSAGDKHDEKILDAIAKVALQLETFNLHYLTKLEDKFVNIVQTMSSLDANVKQLQEKAQVWDIFRHHINSWSDHIKTTDQKIEILKKSLESLPVIENQLQNTDFKVQHVFEKTNLINEKLHEIAKSLLEVRRTPAKQKPGKDKGPKSWSQEDFEQTEILMRLSKIQRVLQNTCSSMRLDKEIEGFKASKTSSSTEADDESATFKTLMAKVNSNLEKIPIKEIRQSLNLNKKQEKTLEALTSTLNHVDERTVRIFDTNSYQFKKLLSCCKSTEHEVLAFTNNANTILKRTEQAIKAVETSSNNEKSNTLNEGEGSSASGEIDDETLDETGNNERSF